MPVEKWLFTLGVAVILTSAAGPGVRAVAPTEEAVAAWIQQGVWDDVIAAHRAFRDAGGDSPEAHPPFRIDRNGRRLALGDDVVDTAYVIVILVDFADNPYTGGAAGAQPYQFDSILFSDGYVNPTGSMTDFYLENSYGGFVVKGDILGWYQAPNTYAYYVSDDYGLSRGFILATHAVQAAAADVPDWSKYDSNNDGYCDGLIIIHAGPGATE